MTIIAPSQSIYTTVALATAMTLAGQDDLFVGSGITLASSNGIGVQGTGSHTVYLNGSVTGTTAMQFLGDSTTIIGAGGLVAGAFTGIFYAGNPTTTVLENAGSIAAETALFLNGGRIAITNTGSILGAPGPGTTPGAGNTAIYQGVGVIGQTYIPSGLASILNATPPLFTVVVMAAAGEEKLHARRIAGVMTGLIGVVILHGAGFDGKGLGFESGQGIGILLCLAGALSYGLSALLARRVLSNSPPLGTATFQLLASTVMMIPVAGFLERPWQLPMPGAARGFRGWPAASTALAYRMFFQILRRSGATNVMLVTLLIPVTAMLLGYLVLGELISPHEILGALVIGSALLLIDGRVLEMLRRSPVVR